MSSKTKERRLQTYPHRWGAGKVHRLLYDSLNKRWYMACRSVHREISHGYDVPDDVEITCKKCLAR